MRIKFADIISLSEGLFEKFCAQKGLLLGHLTPDSSSNGKSLTDFQVFKGCFIDLLKCCMTLLGVLEFDSSFTTEKHQLLISFLRSLCPQHSPSCQLNYTLEAGKRTSGCEYEVIHDHSHATGGINQKANFHVDFLCSVFEVFIDELLLHRKSRKQFIKADKVSDESENTYFVSVECIGDFMAILELVSTHYLLTLYDECAFNRFFRSFYWSKDFDFVPKLTLDSALILLGNEVLLTAPLMLQAHVVSLAAQCITIRKAKAEIKSDPHLFESYLKAFELSVGLYDRCMPLSKCRDKHIDDNIKSRLSIEDRLFCTCIQQVTMEKLTLQTEKLLDFSCRSYLSELPDSKVDIGGYIEENQHVVDESCRDEVLLILNSILSRMSSLDDVQRHRHSNEISAQQKMYYVAAVLKLMSSSLLQIIWFLRKSGSIDGVFTSQIIHERASYLMSFITGSFGKYKVNKHAHEALLSAVKNASITRKAPYPMLSHIVNLLLYSFKRRLEFLQKGCIFLIMTIMDLRCLEDGSFTVFGSFVGCAKGNISSTSRLLKNRRSSTTSLLFKECQSKYLVAEARWDDGVEREDGTDTDDEDHPSCHTTGVAELDGGESYFNSLPEHRRNPSKWTDLTDFVQCKPGRDYTQWGNNKRKYMLWLHSKKAECKYEKRPRKWKKIY